MVRSLRHHLYLDTVLLPEASHSRVKAVGGVFFTGVIDDKNDSLEFREVMSLRSLSLDYDLEPLVHLYLYEPPVMPEAIVEECDIETVTL